MAAGAVALPAGFELEPQRLLAGLPPGFELEQQQGPGLAKSAEYGAASGPGGLGDIMARLPKTLQDAMTALGKMGQGVGARGGMANIGAFMQAPTSEQTRGAYSNVTGRDLPAPQSLPERMVASGASGVTDPISYLGPGSMGLKTLGAVGSGALGEVGQDVAGTPGRVGASLLGGMGAAKTVGPRAVEAAIPTAAEYKTAAKAGYKDAAESGLKVTPQSVANVAENAKQELFREGFDPEGKVYRLLDAAQRGPEAVSSQTLDVINKRLKRMAKEIQMGQSGPEPTENAAASVLALKHFREFGENIPESAVVAGSPQAYKMALGEANQNYTAYKQIQDAENRTRAAVTNTEGGIDVRLDKQLKAQFRPILKSDAKQRGLTEEQVDAINQLNRGTAASNTLGQIGRFSGLSPVGAALNFHALGPMGLLTGLGAAAARKGSESLSRAQAKKIADLAAKRGPLYQQRVSNLPTVDTSPNQAQLLRSAILGLR